MLRKYEIQNTISAASQQGQVLLAILLIMMVGLTVGLGVFKRSTQDVRIGARVEESTQAFAAAEAGIEQTLIGNIIDPGGSAEIAPGITYNVTISDVGGGTGVYPQDPFSISLGEALTVWLVDHDSDGNLVEVPTYTSNTIDICWKNSSSTSALVATLVYKDMPAGTYKIANAAYDSDAASRGNNFDSSIAGGGGDCSDFDFRKNVDFANFGSESSGIDAAVDVLIALRLRPVYAAAEIAIDPSDTTTLAAQGTEIISQGTMGVTSRKIRILQTYNELDSVFDFSLFSRSGDLWKN